MSFRSAVSIICLTLAACSAGAACTPVRIGYINQERPPYWLGNGYAVASPPGASVELVTEFAASAGCGATLLRFPVLRIRQALESGAIDFAPVEEQPDNPAGIVFPLNRKGHPDRERAIRIVIVVFVRASDGLAPATDPARYLRGLRVGTTHGAAYAGQLRQDGIRVDDGAMDVANNIEKLKLGRIDAFAVSLIAPGDMDSFIAARYHGAIVRLARPLSTSQIWLAANRTYYEGHRDQVEAMWTWLGTHGRLRFSALLRKYSSAQ